LESALALILPGSPGGATGASDVLAAAYVDGVLARGELDPDARVDLERGLARLDELARGRGAASFAALDEPAQDAVVSVVVAQDGAWFDAVIDVLMEALVGDPSHGGNPGGVGWAWLGIEPGVGAP
jgi:hypothetical protein